MIAFPLNFKTELQTRLPLVTIILIVLNLVITIFIIPVNARQSAKLSQLKKKWDMDYTEFAIKEAIRTHNFEPTLFFSRLNRSVKLNVNENYRQLTIYRLGFVPAQPNYDSLFIHSFIHGGIFHFLFSMFYLFFLGAILESLLGRSLFLVFALSSSFASAVTYQMIYPQSIIPLISSSGIITGMMGALCITRPQFKLSYFIWFGLPFRKDVSLWQVFPFWLFMDLILYWLTYGLFFKLWGIQVVNVHIAYLGSFLYGIMISIVFVMMGIVDLGLGEEIQLRRVQKFIKNGQFDRAQQQLSYLLQQTRNSPSVLFAYAELHQAMGDHDMAVQYWYDTIKQELRNDKKKYLAQAYLAIMGHRDPDYFSVSEKIAIARNIADHLAPDPVLYKEVATKLIKHIWETHSDKIPISDGICFAGFLDRKCREFSLANEIYSTYWQSAKQYFSAEEMYDYANFLVHKQQDYQTARDVSEQLKRDFAENDLLVKKVEQLLGFIQKLEMR